MRQLFLLSFLFYSQIIFPEGFAAGTLVKIERKYVPIERVHKGAKVISRSLKKYKSRTDKVAYSYRARIPFFVRLTFTNKVIDVASDQEFYIRATKEWVTAAQLVGNRNVRQLFTNQTRLVSAEFVHQPIDVYIFTTKKYHNFLISHDNILVHNFEPSFAIAIHPEICMTAMFEGGKAFAQSGSIWGLIIGLAAAGGYLVYNWATSGSKQKKKARQLQRDLDKARQKQLEKERKATLLPGGPQKDPRNDKDKKKKGRVVNKMTVSEAKKCENFRKYFTHDKNGRYKANNKIKEAKHLKGVKYIEWDATHSDWEAFAKDNGHIGSYDAELKECYKKAVKGRQTF